MACGNCEKRKQVDSIRKIEPIISKIDYSNYFDRVYVINLVRRPDRLESFSNQFSLINFPFKKPEVWEATDGSKCEIPVGFKQGGGAWGCRCSHLSIWKKCIEDGVKNVLIFEDDCIFDRDFEKKSKEFISNLPNNWDMAVFGGQLFSQSRPIKINENVRRINHWGRTHAYALNQKILKDLIEYIELKEDGHIDWNMADLSDLEKYFSYSPSKFICYQGETRSDITGRFEKIRTWNTEDGIIIHLECPRDVLEKLRYDCGIHLGFDIDKETGIDKGLIGEQNKISLRKWSSNLMLETITMKKTVIALWHPQIDRKLVKETFGTKAIFVRGNNADKLKVIINRLIK